MSACCPLQLKDTPDETSEATPTAEGEVPQPRSLRPTIRHETLKNGPYRLAAVIGHPHVDAVIGQAGGRREHHLPGPHLAAPGEIHREEASLVADRRAVLEPGPVGDLDNQQALAPPAPPSRARAAW